MTFYVLCPSSSGVGEGRQQHPPGPFRLPTVHSQPLAQYKTLRITVLSPPLPRAGKRQHCFFLSYDDISPCSPRRRLQHSLPFGEFQFQRSKREGRKEGEQKERMNRNEGERERGRKRGEGRREEEQGRVLPVSVHFHSSIILILTSLIYHFDFQSNNLEYYTKLSPILSPTLSN